MKKGKSRFMRLTSVICTMIIVFTIFTSSVMAYSINGSHIENTIVFIPHSGYSSTSISHFNEALWRWNSASGKTLMKRDATERHNKTNYPIDDGQNLIYRVNTGTDDYVGQTQRYVRNSVTYSADINLNMYYDWANSRQISKFDVWTVFIHEAGHAAGLAHNNNINTVMYPHVNMNSLKRELHDDDINGISYIYGSRSTYPDYSTEEMEGLTNCVLSGSVNTYEYEDLLERAHLVVRAKVIDQSETFQIKPVFGGTPSNFSDFTMNITDVLCGDKKIGDDIKVRVQGGVANGLNLTVESAPDFQVGDDVLVFLYQPNMGSGYNTEGDYYYTLGLYQGAYFNDNGKYMNVSNDVNVKFANADGNEIDLNELEKDVKKQSKSVNKNWLYDQFFDNLNSNLESGFIDQVEYERLLAETKEYAVIIDNEDKINQKMENDNCYEELSKDELVKRSSLIVSGIVNKKSETFGINPTFGGETKNYNDFNVKITDTIRGNSSNDNITVRVPVDSKEVIKEGDSVLLFLYQPNMGSGYNTEGDYYYISGGKYNGLYFRTESERAQQIYDIDNKMINENDFIRDIKELSDKYSIKENISYQKFLENQKNNLEDGFINKEEYDSLLSETKEYAQIVPAV